MLINFSWVESGRMAGMGQPRHPYGDELLQEGVRAIVSLTEHVLERERIETRGFSYLHLPVPDMQRPTASVIGKFIEFAMQEIQDGRPVVVHCSAGLGRTGTLLACYLVHAGYSVSGAVGKIRELRPGSIETPQQEVAIFEYAESGKTL